MPGMRRPLRKFRPEFLKANRGGFNEADTAQRIISCPGCIGCGGHDLQWASFYDATDARRPKVK